ncbi:MAG: hypothetical protein HUU55_06550 [Myxococcales bacterium]|nr:hypothetical protein [Myxococcales bacterium]
MTDAAPPKSTPSMIPLNVDIFIGEDGEVIFTDLPAELAEIVLELDPEASLACDIPIPLTTR